MGWTGHATAGAEVVGEPPAPHGPAATAPGVGVDGERPRLASVLAAGIAVGIVEVALAASLASLIWTGPLAVHLPQGIGLGLFGAMVIMTGVALLSSAPGTVGSVQDIPAAILAVVAASVAGGLSPAAPSTFLTVTLLIGVSSLAVGAFFWLLGRFRLGRLVRYLPYPVVGGFLGGTGVLLATGSLGVLTGTDLSAATVPALLASDLVVRWVPGLALALLLLVISRRSLHPLLLPGVFLGAILLFHVVLLAGGTGIAEAQRGGWLLGPFPGEGLWRPWLPDAVGQADWLLVARQTPAVATVLLFSAMGLLLNAGGIEMATRRDADLDRELRGAGLANVLAGLGGGLPGYHAVSLTALARQMGGGHRLVGLVAGSLCGLALLVGAGVLALIPRFVVGGLILFVGLALVVEWLVDAWHHLPTTEYLVLTLIVVVITGWGFAAGVITGLVAAVVLFLVTYSRVSVVGHASSGRERHSNVDRPAADHAALCEDGHHVEVLSLQGFLFFGTANALFERVRSRVVDPAAPRLRHLVLGFRRVTGLDSSAVQSFEKIRLLAEVHDLDLVLADVAEPLRRILAAAGLDGAHASVRFAPDADRAIEWCEDRLLLARAADEPDHRAEPEPEPEPEDWDDEASGYALAPLRPYLERMAVPAGHVVLRAGDPSDDLFLLAAGQLTAAVARDDGQVARLRTVRPGSVVGEIGLYLGTARTAAVVADRPSTLYRLSRASLAQLERERPADAVELHAWLARLMARRIADDVATITALLD